MSHLYFFCDDKKWDEIQAIFDSESIKREVVCYQGSVHEFNGWTILHRACCNKPPPKIIKSLLDVGGKQLVMMTSHGKLTALHNACSYGASFDIIKALIDVGGKELVMAKNKHGSTALHSLCYNVNDHNKAVDKINFMLQGAGAETVLKEKN